MQKIKINRIPFGNKGANKFLNIGLLCRDLATIGLPAENCETNTSKIQAYFEKIAFRVKYISEKFDSL